MSHYSQQCNNGHLIVTIATVLQEHTTETLSVVLCYRKDQRKGLFRGKSANLTSFSFASKIPLLFVARPLWCANIEPFGLGLG